MPQVVELYGLPGAGKTTVTRGIGPDGGLITRDQVSAEWRALPVWRRLSYVARAIGDIRWSCAVLSLARGTPLTQSESFGRLLRLMVTKPWLRSLDGIVLFDQGLMQRLWSIFYTESIKSPPHAALTRLLGEYYRGLSVRIVMIAVPPEIAAKRVHQRDFGSSRLDELPEQTVLARLRGNLELTDAISRAARDAGLRIVILDGTVQPVELTRQIEDILKGAERPELSNGSAVDESLSAA